MGGAAGAGGLGGGITLRGTRPIQPGKIANAFAMAIGAAGCILFCGDALAALDMDLTPPPDTSEQAIPNSSAQPPTVSGIPAPVSPPFSNDYSSVAEPRLEFPTIQTMNGGQWHHNFF